MKKVFFCFSLILLVFCLSSNDVPAGEKKYKCMLQMINYSGEGAYVIVSLINPKGEYEKTIYVHGDDSEWYYEMGSWWKWYGKKRTGLDGITGATVGGGERAISVLTFNEDQINKGYKLRFESAVEDQDYFEKDIEFRLTRSNLEKKIEGKGYVRYVRFIPI